MNYTDIALPLAVNQLFTYTVPPTVGIKPGHRVLVFLGKKKLIGFVILVHDQKPDIPDGRLKPILQVLDTEPLLTVQQLEWFQWMSRYYLAPLGEVLATALPAPFFKTFKKKNIADVSSERPILKSAWGLKKNHDLNPDQKAALAGLVKKGNQFQVSLLFGITGSGKTEVYLHWARHLVEQNKQVLILVPEIGLTPQTIAEFERFFGADCSVYHSGLTPNQRTRQWQKVRKGEIKIMIGTRSAVFLPFKNLGTIIMDEEHDASFKQEEHFRYHARSVAIMLAKMQNIPVLLGSATPALETYYHALQKKYQLYTLDERTGVATKPSIHLVDMAAQKRQNLAPLSLCAELTERIQKTLEQKNQILILINRRGFARSFFCLSCEQSARCPNCSVNLVYHSPMDNLRCHYCDYKIQLPKTCSRCGGHEITLLGLGTQTVEKDLRGLFPLARIARLDRDAVSKHEHLLTILKNFKEHRIDILLGTQMIAKGHDMPRVTLVGVIDVDQNLGLPDFRASERTFQLLLQVAGRAGRGELKGEVIVQSYTPKHYSIALACQQDFAKFCQLELANRQELAYPPFGRLVEFEFSALDEKKLVGELKKIAASLHANGEAWSKQGIQILGPAPSPIGKIRSRFRWHFLLKGKDLNPLHQVAEQLAQHFKNTLPRSIRWHVDVDPVSLM